MKNFIKKFMLISSVSVAVLMVFAVPVLAATITAGNDNIIRTQLDVNSNFTVIDTNHPVSAAGTISQFDYYAANTNPFRFVIADGSNVVQFVSDQITPVVGTNTFTLTTPFAVQAGWNVGMYFTLTGTIPYDATGADSWATANASGMPVVGNTLSVTDVGARTYSLVATGTATPILTSVTVAPTTATINVAATQQLTPSPLDQDSAAYVGATFTYSSDNTAVATVDTSGLVTAVSTGTANITVTATSGAINVTATSVITVSTTAPYLPPSIATPDVSFYVGNDALTAGTQLDTFNNFTVVDTNNPAPQAGDLSEFDYYASNMNPFYFIVVDGSNNVKWISDQITPSVIGFNDYEPAIPVPVQAGWNVGMYFTLTGTIPYDATGADAWASDNSAGMPVVGNTLSVTDVGARTYSFVAASFTATQGQTGNHHKIKQNKNYQHINGNSNNSNGDTNQNDMNINGGQTDDIRTAFFHRDFHRNTNR